MNKHLLVFVCAFIISLAPSVPVEAALFDRGGGLIYDSVKDLTWLQDASASPLNNDPGYASAWSESLEYYDAVRDVTWDDWRAASNSEMSSLFYVSGVSSATPDLFINVQPDYYWSSTFHYPYVGLYVDMFSFETGDSYPEDQSWLDHHERAVRDGDVGGIGEVPVPAAGLLFGSGLIGLFGLSRRKVRV